jgi:hypothetical protein
VWFDDRIKPGTYFQQEIQQKLKNTPVFVAVISPSYLASENCVTHELEWFQNQGGTDVIQLVKVPLETGQAVPVPAADFITLHDTSDGHVLQGKALEKPLDEVVAVIKTRLREFWDLRPEIFVVQLRDEGLKDRWQKLTQCQPASSPSGRMRSTTANGMAAGGCLLRRNGNMRREREPANRATGTWTTSPGIARTRATARVR